MVMSPPILETDILKPRDPSVNDNPDEWPEFVLSKAHVHLPDDPDSTVDLLQAAAGFPLTVVGQLEPLDDEDAHLYRQAPTRKRTNIVLEDVFTYSYGQYGDGSTAIWAAGKSGWFVVKPGRRYKTVYNEMVEAVNLLYFIADAYRTPRKQGQGRNATVLPDYTAQEIFDKYAAEELGSSDPGDGREKIHEHKDFLISSMLAGKEGLVWSKYPLYRHLYAKYRDIFAEKHRRMVPIETVSSKAARSRQGRQPSVDSASTTNTLQRRRGRLPKGPVEVISLDETSEASSVVKQARLEKAESRPQTATIGKRPARRTRQSSVATSSQDVRQEEHAMTPTGEDDTDEETKLRARKNKSSLRPRASKASKSAVRRAGKGLAPNEEDDQEPDPMTSPTAAGKRRYPEASSHQRPFKRRNSRPHEDEGIDIPTSPSTDAPSPGSDSARLGETTDLALRGLAHIPDSLQEDTWICALDGCTHKVFAASHPDSQRLIREHYALHAYDDDERVRMVKKLQAPSLPAGHLMERVKQQAKMDGFPASFEGQRQMGSRYPTILPSAKLAVVQRY